MKNKREEGKKKRQKKRRNWRKYTGKPFYLLCSWMKNAEIQNFISMTTLTHSWRKFIPFCRWATMKEWDSDSFLEMLVYQIYFPLPWIQQLFFWFYVFRGTNLTWKGNVDGVGEKGKDNTDDNNNKQEPINKAFQLSILILQGVPFLMCSIPIIQIINWFNIFSRVDPDLTFSSTKLQRNL